MNTRYTTPSNDDQLAALYLRRPLPPPPRYPVPILRIQPPRRRVKHLPRVRLRHRPPARGPRQPDRPAEGHQDRAPLPRALRGRVCHRQHGLAHLYPGQRHNPSEPRPWHLFLRRAPLLARRPLLDRAALVKVPQRPDDDAPPLRPPCGRLCHHNFHRCRVVSLRRGQLLVERPMNTQYATQRPRHHPNHELREPFDPLGR